MCKGVRVLSLDPGTKSTGVSILEARGKDDVEVLFVETLNGVHLAKLNPASAWLRGNRYAQVKAIGKYLHKLLVMYEVDFVVSECPYLGKFAAAFAALTEILWEFKSRTDEYDLSCPFEILEPSAVKTAMGVKGTSGDKELMTAAIMDLLDKNILYSELNINFADLDEHSIDSLCVGKCFIDSIF